MSTAADLTIVEVAGVVEPKQIHPEAVVTPSIYVDRVLDLASSAVRAT